MPPPPPAGRGTDRTWASPTTLTVRGPGGPTSSPAAGHAALEHLKIHGLRHFVATELLTAGIDVRTVANRLGHARTSTTLDIYWAWVPARDRDAADHLGTVLSSPPPELR